jgi:hypothetical protein
MRIGIYALAKNAAQFVDRWHASTAGADVCVVTDTGSVDGTDSLLASRGVTVVPARIVPWRWDVAHTQSLNALPPDLDLCIRLDMDETLVSGWRDLVERLAVERDGLRPTKIRHLYQWAPGVTFALDRVHSRDGYRYTGATHEGLVRWHGEERTACTNELLIVQDRGEREPERPDSDRMLLEVAVRESPQDARMRWYFARELDYASDPRAVAEYLTFLSLPGGSFHERAHACRQMSLLCPSEARHWLMKAFVEAPAEPEAACRLAWDCRSKKDFAGTFYWGSFAIQANPELCSHASDPSAYGPLPWLWTAEAAMQTGQYANAGRIARDALRRFPGDARITALVDLAGAFPANEPGPER